MSRKVRHSFAAPLVLIACAPACVVHTSPNPPPRTTTSDSSNATTPPTVMTNPPRTTEEQPRPVDPRANFPDTPPPDTAQQGPAPRLTTWSVYQNKRDNACFAQVAVKCPPKATCNPPPPRAIDCPSGIAVDRPVRIVEQSAGQCVVEVAQPACPPNMACNPPRPQQVACPQ